MSTNSQSYEHMQTSYSHPPQEACSKRFHGLMKAQNADFFKICIQADEHLMFDKKTEVFVQCNYCCLQKDNRGTYNDSIGQ